MQRSLVRSVKGIIHLLSLIGLVWGFLGGSAVKNPPAMQEPQEMPVRSLSREDPREEEMATHSSILAWKTPWTEEPGGLQSTGLQRAGKD